MVIRRVCVAQCRLQCAATAGYVFHYVRWWTNSDTHERVGRTCQIFGWMPRWTRLVRFPRALRHEEGLLWWRKCPLLRWAYEDEECRVSGTQSGKKRFVSFGSWVLEISEYICSPSIAISASEVSPGDLFQDVCDVESFNGRGFRDVLKVTRSHFLEKWRKRKCPFIRTNCNEEWRITILAHGIYEIQVLMLPEGLRKWFIFQAVIGRATGGLGGIDCTSNGLKQPPVVLVLWDLKVDGKVVDWWQQRAHKGDFPSSLIVLAFEYTLTEGSGVVQGRPQSALYTPVKWRGKDFVKEWWSFASKNAWEWNGSKSCLPSLATGRRLSGGMIVCMDPQQDRSSVVPFVCTRISETVPFSGGSR